ncbi:MAG: hypothetical protein K9J16_08490 [Melioribacteraceae bacterium]|nr:hypothetical protein [Melioribacteraceae bacterium]MCF8353818.1 hypothetical protein [Melioribacteraceae bacterium]MCF8393654.1 hypothetical protein [Melioribacteraceae bacterium]MCF8419464.1 hypothetical protein [Melioribacteraceae bacterium]
MKKYVLILFITLIFIGNSNAQDQGFGAGIILGEPTGLSGKLWVGNITAFDFAAAWAFKGDGNLLLQADHVWHRYNLINVSTGKLPLYYGLGGRVILASNDPYLGIRFPVGLAYQFSGFPADLFFELVPIMDLAPATDFDFGGGLGFRYFF